MLSVTRKQKIKDWVMEKKSASVTELAATFSVTSETIRRDLKQLEQDGVLMRTYGGAFIQTGVENLVDASLRIGIYIENKKKIAQKCRDFVQNGDAIFIDNSTTAHYIAEEIQDKRITLVTNSLSVIKLLSKNKNIHLISLGGKFSVTEQAFSGTQTLNALSNYYVDKAFFSCRSISMETGLTEANEEWANVRSTAIRNSKKNYLVADFSKFGYSSFIRICGFELITAIITDMPLSDEWHQILARHNCGLYDHLDDLTD